YEFEVVEIPAQLIDDAAVSSTKVRQAIAAGQVEEATNMLGRNYSLAGRVHRGAQLGRTIGYPTANIVPAHAEQIVPATGVYAIRIWHSGDTHNTILNMGYWPTVGREDTVHNEAHIFVCSADVYDEQREILFIARLRDEQKCASLDDLKAQLKKDE